MGPSPTIFVPSAVHYGSDDADYFEIVLDEDDVPTYILHLGAGDDRVLFDTTGIALSNGKLLLFGGEGSDTIEGVAALGSNVTADGGSGGDYIDIIIMMPPPVTFDETAAAGSLAIDGGDGDDEVYLKYELQKVLVTNYTISGATEVDLGAGNDGLYYIIEVEHQIGGGDDPIPIDTFSLNFTKIEAGAGDDCVIFDIVGTGPAGAGRVDLGPLQISTGDGNDEVAVGITGEYIDSIIMLNGVVETGAGDDSVVMNDVNLSNSRIDTGEGNDSIIWSFLLTGDNEVPPVSGDDGRDTLVGGLVDIDTGADDDYICISGAFSFSESLAPVTIYNVHGGSGHDDFDVTLDVDGPVAGATGVLPSKLGMVQLYGEQGDDSFDVEVTLTGQAEFGILVDGGGGNDNISVKPLLIIAEDVESEALGTLVVNKLRGGLKVKGGDGDDTISVFAEASDEVGPEDAFHVRGDAGMDTFVVTKGQETVVIDDFTLGEDELFLNGIFSEDQFDATLVSMAGSASTGIYDEDANLLAVLQNVAPEDLTRDYITLGEYIPVS